ncbi:UNVERIFIED_CONTAM: hypothetical protein Scaly_0186400 [Sesamum calycinum]|uniref:Uncharacterized protein n=1 Tax=Sesamum calycinum TaxID=2727403 RepID=A0AAW2SZ41_9LAMI
MANSNNEGDNGSYEGNSSLSVVAGPTVPPADSVALERGGTPRSKGVDEQISTGLQQDQSVPANFASKKTAFIQPSEIFQTPMKEMVELHHQGAKETMRAERGIPFNEHIMAEELPTHFRAPSHLPTYDGTTDPIEHIHNETLRTYVQRFNTTTLEVPTTHLEVLVSVLAKGLLGGPLVESLAKKPTVDFLAVLA